MTTDDTKWALITGAGPGGLGEAEANAFLHRGINVFATSVDIETTKHVSPIPGTNEGFLIQMHLDVTSEKSISHAFDFVQQITNGKLAYLINNAGYGYFTPLLDVDIARAKRQYDVNVWGALAVTRAFYPLLRAAKGIVVNQASVAGLPGFNRPFMGIYSSSKAALLSLNDAMRMELEPFGVKVVALVTSAVKTDFATNARGGKVVEGSLYMPVREEVERAMSDDMTSENGHDRIEVARKLMEVLLGEKTPLYVRNGYMATLIWLLHLLLPVWLLDLMHRSGSGLERLKMLMTNDEAEKQD
ncbi:Putative short-chain dehydrogenase/reductase SDR, NAD(P)-binding domain superfamily [Septoria linicola]|uniref:Short-chain dehydrogenase/reductase SDR, NAD(P)-binding domain superfamily n=1 Tax=Septoria linicola TaxID=215465 RepID=A0A9Q9AZ11_9PEZI|nr:putative short-chain dehydrogenase/reductase SDR, NAD(P)-binding domain superfamily [Septoria linicola]USW53261.1 Putative short-chain dehydrogenase/reductase SDR, NAD(P)-binding domain superfamily [Septoria linicola]